MAEWILVLILAAIWWAGVCCGHAVAGMRAEREEWAREEAEHRG